MILPRFLAQPHIPRGQRNKRKPHAKPTKRPCPVARKIWSKKIISTVPLERSPEQLNFQFARIQASAFITLPKPIYLLRVVKAPFCSPAASLSSQPTISTPVKMSSYNKDQKDFGEAPKVHRVRITLTSKKVQALEKVCSELVERAKSKELRVKGPVRLPTKILKITTRKTPCGEGSKTWDLFEMRIHKRLIDLTAPTEIVKQIIVNIEAGVEVEVTIAA
ncbi:hypothetical protein SMACR_05897 [Sordaria macrospora]|nr:hypothetical protein SMACR_05897 [Sordaria macrospora]WPJ65363.1 hypothetical protein SMAC4_05897 [Sordaria macrospora]